eukprot:s2072_g11.t1
MTRFWVILHSLHSYYAPVTRDTVAFHISASPPLELCRKEREAWLGTDTCLDTVRNHLRNQSMHYSRYCQNPNPKHPSFHMMWSIAWNPGCKDKTEQRGGRKADMPDSQTLHAQSLMFPARFDR